MKLGVKTLTDYVGRDDARILEESGYRSREDDLMSAKVVDLLLIGSFPCSVWRCLIVATCIGKSIRESRLKLTIL